MTWWNPLRIKDLLIKWLSSLLTKGLLDYWPLDEKPWGSKISCSNDFMKHLENQRSPDQVTEWPPEKRPPGLLASWWKALRIKGLLIKWLDETPWESKISSSSDWAASWQKASWIIGLLMKGLQDQRCPDQMTERPLDKRHTCKFWPIAIA